MLIAAVLIGVVAIATVLGLVWRATSGRVRSGRGTAKDGSAREYAHGPATLLQFSTEVCAPCAATHTLLTGIADERLGVAYVDVDVTHRPDIANRFNLLQSPTTLVLDAGGNVRARIGGTPRPAEVRAALDLVLA
jgi:thiol-disulfide isomerase/thioredoxin